MTARFKRTVEMPESNGHRLGEITMLVVLSAALVVTGFVIVLVWETLTSVQDALPTADLQLSHDMQKAARDLERTRNAIIAVRAAPSATMLNGLSVAASTVDDRFLRDEKALLRGYDPDLAKRVAALIPKLDSIRELATKGPPVDDTELEHALAAVEAARLMLDAEHLKVDAVAERFMILQRRKINKLAENIPVALAFLFAFAIGSAFLFHQRRAALARLRHSAWHDSLTGIPNRAAFLKHCQTLIKAGADQKPFALVLIDLDRFKEVNDAFGHRVGDQLLQELAQYFSNNTRTSDFVARLGGDEFVLVAHAMADEAEAADFIKRLSRPLQGYINLSRFNVPVSCSMGMAFFPRDASNIDDLLRHADLALYEAKDKGQGSQVAFTPDLLEKYTNRLELEHYLRMALLKDEFFVVWQPQFDLRSGSVGSLEALVRWRHPNQKRVVAPGEFLPVAEESGLASKLDLRVLEIACRQAEEWRHGDVGPIRIAVNLSGHHFKSTAIVGRIVRTLATTGLPPELLEVEITENIFIENKTVATDVVRALRDRGIGVALDDFGTGYSNLSYLADLGLTSLKIDRSFVHKLVLDERKQALLHIIIALGRAFDLTVVAEGVETWPEFEFFLNSDCDVLQGYLISTPLTNSEFEAWFAESDNVFTDFKVEALHDLLRKGAGDPPMLAAPAKSARSV